MAKLTRLKINKFRNVEPVELKFSQGMNVLLGINGSGKTTFLELIAALLNQDVSGFRDEEFSVSYDIVLAGGIIAINLENRPLQYNNGDKSARFRQHRGSQSKYTLHVHVRLNVDALEIEYLIDANRVSTTVISRNKSSGLETKSQIPSHEEFDERYLSNAIAPIAGNADWDQAAVWQIDRLRSIFRFDESLQFWDFLISYIIGYRNEHIGNDDHWLVLFTENKNGNPDFWFDTALPISESLESALNERAQDSWPEWRGSEIITFSMHNLAFLQQAVTLTGFQSGKLELRFGKSIHHQDNGDDFSSLDFGELRFWFEKIDGTIIPEQKLSYGQKRLLSFLYYLDCNPHIIIADELANGLHHAWITACIDAIGDRQAFLASQNPLLLDEIDLSSVEEVERSFVLCRCDTSSGKERLSWSNMTTYDAERFFEAYNVGLQHVSEILRTKRLW